MINLILTGFINFNLKIISFFLTPLFTFLNTFPGVGTFVNPISRLLTQIGRYIFFIKSILLIPNTVILAFISGCLFLLGLCQLMFFYSLQVKIIGFIRR